jgi:MSHA biogenesis protein MshP
MKELRRLEAGGWWLGVELSCVLSLLPRELALSNARQSGSPSTSSLRPPAHSPRSGPHFARGASLVSALFLIVVVAALGAFAVRIGSGQQHTVNLALLSSRALAAANAGVEWAAHRALPPAGGPGACANGVLNLAEGALAGFTVTVTCAATNHAEGAGTTTIFAIESFAQFGTYGSPDYVSRRVRARFTNAP